MVEGLKRRRRRIRRRTNKRPAQAPKAERGGQEIGAMMVMVSRSWPQQAGRPGVYVRVQVLSSGPCQGVWRCLSCVSEMALVQASEVRRWKESVLGCAFPLVGGPPRVCQPISIAAQLSSITFLSQLSTSLPLHTIRPYV